MMNAEIIVRRTISEQHLIASGDHIVLGLSGGPDSLCLLHVLTELRKELGFSLSCLHLNHLMRGEQAREDVQWLTAHCKSLSVSLTVEVCDVEARARLEKRTVEEAGRQARQEALFARAREEEAQCCGSVRVALAHNRDDQAETVLLRILRGTGVHGLSAMEYCRADGLIRPLLDTSRKEVEAYCDEKGLSPRWDSTNASTAFTRNRLRLELIPLLEAQFNSNIREGLVRLSDNAREDDRCLSHLAMQQTASARTPEKGGGAGADLAFPMAELASMDPAVGKRVVRLLFDRIGLQEDIASVHLAALWKALEKGDTGTVIEFPGGYRTEISYGDLLFKHVDLDASFDADPAWDFVQLRLPAAEAPDPKTLPLHQALLDADKVERLGAPLNVRTRLPGDRIWPLGGPGTKKLQDHFVDAKVPKNLRDRIPLICCDSEILWICGGTVSEKVKVTPLTQRMILLEINERIC
jgi:tRNA(Ile)-lysidine synthase